ncbi:MAG: YqaJ viral recombinase family protein [Propionibacterium sp.]|nr:YqaJ viral recombinase family protein [Propionibacterium sp.]
MTTTILRMEQRSGEWLEARRGIITASQIGPLITPKTLKVSEGKAARGVAIALAAERISGIVESNFITSDMWRGIEEEPLARAAYEANRFVTVDTCGLMIRDDNLALVGFSPDGLVGDDGLIEIKSRRHRVHMESVLDGIPENVTPQLQCGLYVSQRSWIDYVSYSGGMHLWIERVYPDPGWQDAIAQAVQQVEKAVDTITAEYLARVAGFPVQPVTPDYSDIKE